MRAHLKGVQRWEVAGLKILLRPGTKDEGAVEEVLLVCNTVVQ